MTDEEKKSVCVVGAGISGLVTAKTLLADGFSVHVIERDLNLGGTWAPSRTYPGLKTNNSKNTYAFSDFPYEEGDSLFPTATEVQQYLERYADKFGLRERIQFNTEVVDISRAGKGLAVTTRSPAVHASEEITQQFDFVAVCTGVYHIPNVPSVENADQFGGCILHSSEVTESTYSEGQRVIVVGAGKSAFDCAVWAAKRELSPTLLYRRPQWMVPRYLPGGRVTGDRLVTSRFLAFLLEYHRKSRVEQFLHGAGKPLINAWWWLVSVGWRRDLSIPPSLVPDEKLPAGLEKVGAGGDFYTALKDGTASAVRGSIRRFRPDGVELVDGTHLDADVVVFATGWQHSVSYLSDELRQEIAPGNQFRLFRHILSPTAQNLGFIGHASSFACQLTSEIGAHWLSEHFLGTLRLPPVAQMNEEIDHVHAWADLHLSNRGTEGFVGPHIPHYLDELMGDLRLDKRRPGSYFQRHFGSARASSFATLSEERHQLRGT